MTEDSKLYLLLYVDDIIIGGNNKLKLFQLKDASMQEFPITNLKKLQNFFGMKIKKRTDSMFLSQRTYMERFLERFNMSECKPIGISTEAQVNQDETKPYRELIECLMFFMLNTRSDINVSVNYFSKF